MHRKKEILSFPPIKYKPSIGAMVFNIRGKQIKGTITGKEIRPIPIEYKLTPPQKLGFARKATFQSTRKSKRKIGRVVKWGL